MWNVTLSYGTIKTNIGLTYFLNMILVLLHV
jgi:hypothetical protein